MPTARSTPATVLPRRRPLGVKVALVAAPIGIWLLTLGFDALIVWGLVGADFLGPLASEQPLANLVLAYAAILAIIAVTLSYGTVGLVLVGRPGAGRIGTILLAGGLGFAAIPFGYIVGGSLVRYDPRDPIANAIFLIGPGSIGAGYSLILPAVALVFPDGRLPSARWRWPVWSAFGLLVATTSVILVTPGSIADTPSHNPFGIDQLPREVVVASQAGVGVAILAISVLGVGAVIARYRAGTFLLRRQLRWFVAAVLLAGLPLALSPQPGIGGPVWGLVAGLGLLLVPVSVWIAVTRYRLYEIDRLISRTLAYATLTSVLAAVYAAGFLVLQAVLAPFTSGGGPIAVAASTLAAFALFQPLRRRLQATMDRRFNRSRYDAKRTVEVFAAHLRNEVDLERLGGDLRTVVGQSLAPTSVGVWLRPSERRADR